MVFFSSLIMLVGNLEGFSEYIDGSWLQLLRAVQRYRYAEGARSRVLVARRARDAADLSRIPGVCAAKPYILRILHFCSFRGNPNFFSSTACSLINFYCLVRTGLCSVSVSHIVYIYKERFVRNTSFCAVLKIYRSFLKITSFEICLSSRQKILRI